MTGFPLSREVAGRLDVVAATGSTNADLLAVAHDVDEYPHLSVRLTEDQTAGRGRLDRTWVAPAGSAIALSVLLRRLPPPTARGWIPLAAGAAMAGAIAAQLPENDVEVKWPNDVLVGGRKICGILAEATADAVVLGTGVNTAMAESELPVPTATSFRVLGVDADGDRLVSDYLRRLEALLADLIAHDGDAAASGLHDEVTARCATVGLDVRVMLPGDTPLDGRAVAIDPDGRLIVRTPDADVEVSAGDVVHVRPG